MIHEELAQGEIYFFTARFDMGEMHSNKHRIDIIPCKTQILSETFLQCSTAVISVLLVLNLRK